MALSLIRRAGVRAAKVTLPSPAANVLARPRLYTALADAPVAVWIGAPAAAGKTTLAASALRHAATPVVWYQIDRDDADPGTFFHYLAKAAAACAPPRRLAALPQYSREVGDALGAFAEVWLRALFALLPSGATLVFDDWHRLADDSPLQTVLVRLIDGLPADLRVWVASRRAPPPGLASAQLRGRLATLDFADLALTEAEAGALVACHAPDAQAGFAASWHRWCEGWIGALVFALAAGRRAPGNLPPAPDAATTDTVFGFLAAEFFERAEAPLREFLLDTAWLPFLSEPLARRLYPKKRVAAHLANLAASQLLLAAHDGGERRWRYHRLLREFLQRRARETWRTGQLATRLARAAAALEAEKLPEAAAQLYVEAAAWGALASLIAREAPALLRAGRYHVLAGWAQAIPAGLRTPATAFWLASALLALDTRAAYGHFQHAWAGYATTDDAAGLYQTWCGAVEAITYGCDDYGELELWLDRLRVLRARHRRFPSLLLRAQVTVFAFSATFFLRPNAPEFPLWRRGVERLYRIALRRADRVAIGGLIGLYHSTISGMGALGAHLAGLRPLLDDPAVPAYPRLIAKLPDAIHHWIAGSSDTALERLDAAMALAAESGAHGLDRQFHFQYVFVHGVRGELDLLDRHLERLGETLPALGQIDLAQFYFVSGWRAALGGRTDEAARLLETAVDYARQRQFAFFEALCGGLHAELLALAGDAERARATGDAALATAIRLGSATARAVCAVQRAAVAELTGEPAVHRHALLADAFGFNRRHDHYAWGGFFPLTLSRLCLAALDAGIETGYARELIRRHRLAPPANVCADAWPWPLRITSFGGLQLVRDGTPLVFDGKVQRRPLELLRGLLALGGRQVADSQLIDWLWPGSEGDAGQRALITTLQRLRELVGARGAFVHSGGRLTLDPARVWFDGWAFDAALAEARLDAAETLYRGDFLAGDSEAWLFARREALQQRFVRALLDAADVCADVGQRVRLAERALVADATAEAAYQRLIAHYLEDGQNDLAWRTWERCRRALAERLGVLPSPRTVALSRQIPRSVARA